MPFKFANYYVWVEEDRWKRFGLAIQKSREWAPSPFSDPSKISYIDGPKTAEQFLNMAALIPAESRMFRAQSYRAPLVTDLKSAIHSQPKLNISEGINNSS